ncbi:pitrilysin family protein [Mollicutes bacterium LVI A0039]|nr:pitrilysin family protein [Mollicutes bacterium LVI A0039]
MKINKLNEQFDVHVLKNGLTVYLYHNPEFTNMYANYTVDFGSIDTEYQFLDQEYTDPQGIAHYLEHLMFADGENDYFDYFSKLGASSNAYTSFNQTSYLFNASSNYEQCLKYLIDMVQTLKIDDVRVNEEFGVIKEEIEMYNSKPNFILQNMIFSSTCSSNYKNDIAGTVESIEQISYEHIKRLFEIFYAPSNATLFIASNQQLTVDFLESIQVIDELKPVPRLRRDLELPEVNSEFDHAYSNVASDTQMMVSVKFPVCADIKELILADISFEIFVIWLTSDLNPNYSKAIDQQLINETFNGYHMLDKTINMLVFKIRLNDHKNVLDYIESQIGTLTDAMIEVIKRKKIGSEIRLFNDPESICEYGLDLILRDIDMNEYFDYLYQVDSHTIANYISEQMSISQSSVQMLSKNKEGE